MSRKSEIKEVFDMTMQGAENVVTPVICDYGETDKYYYEVSSNVRSDGSLTGLLPEGEVWGLTIINKDDLSVNYDLSKPFDSKLKLELYKYKL